MNTRRGHGTVEHAADMGIKGWGCNEKEAFEEIALAMFELIVDGEGIKPVESVEIMSEGDDSEELLVDFLNKLLMRADIEELVFLGVRIERISGDTEKRGRRLLAVARGVPLDEVREKLIREVKAATYYGVSVTSDRFGNTTATVVVDL